MKALVVALMAISTVAFASPVPSPQDEIEKNFSIPKNEEPPAQMQIAGSGAGSGLLDDNWQKVDGSKDLDGMTDGRKVYPEADK